MQIAELKEGMKNINKIEASVETIKSIENVKGKDGKEYKITKALISDSSGKITLNLWNEDGMKVKSGSKIIIENGYITTFKGYRSLNIGKYGQFHVLQF